MGVDFGHEGTYVTIIKNNDFVSKVIASGEIDALIKKGKKYPIEKVTSGAFIPYSIIKKIRKLIKD